MSPILDKSWTFATSAPFGMTFIKSSDFEKRRKEVVKFNQENRWRKRGIVMVPQKHGIGFTEPRGSLNSSSALVTVNMADGIGFHLPWWSRDGTGAIHQAGATGCQYTGNSY